jgi:hypothetical protein
MHPVLKRLLEAHPRVCVRAYLDDVTVIGTPERVAAFYVDFVIAFHMLGLLVNTD